ncbi:MAG: sugar ABC transporter substrate-binding protein [Actinomycetota bacterium]
MRRHGRVLIALVCLALLGAACGQEATRLKGPLAGTALTFSISLAEEENAAVRELLGRFQQRTGATVELVAVTAPLLPEKLKVELRAGRRPTIHLFAQDNFAQRSLVDNGLVEDLSDTKIPDGLLPVVIPETFEGKQYFLPFRPNVRVAYVNRERFDQAKASAPKTVEELRTVAQKLEATAGTGKVTLSLAQGDPAAVTISEWILSFGGNPLLLNDEGSEAAFEFLQRMWREGLLARESLQGQYDTEVDNLRGETAWLAQNWTFTSGVLDGEGLLDRFQVYEGWSGPARAAHVVGGDVLGIPKGVTGKQKEGALSLANFLMSRKAQEFLAEKNSWPSIYSDAYDRIPSDRRSTLQAASKALESGWLRPGVPYWPEVAEAMNEAIRRILQDGEPVKPVLDNLHAKIAAEAKMRGAEYPPAS